MMKKFINRLYEKLLDRNLSGICFQGRISNAKHGRYTAAVRKSVRRFFMYFLSIYPISALYSNLYSNVLNNYELPLTLNRESFSHEKISYRKRTSQK